MRLKLWWAIVTWVSLLCLLIILVSAKEVYGLMSLGLLLVGLIGFFKK